MGLSIMEDDGTKEEILNGKFSFMIKPGVPYHRILRRLLKYNRRGFELNKLEFD